MTKAKSRARASWLKANRRTDAQKLAEQKYNAKRKADRAEAKAVRKIKKALGVK